MRRDPDPACVREKTGSGGREEDRGRPARRRRSGAATRAGIGPRAFRAGAFLAALLLAAPAVAQEGQVDDLFAAMRLDELLAVMRGEGLDNGDDLAAEMLGAEPPGWDAALAAIYDPEAMEAAVRAGLEERLEGADMAPAIAFFTAEPGRSFVDYELAAREALRDPDIEQAARETAALAMADATERLRLITGYVEANDLIEANVTGGLNGNYAFFSGLAEGGALPPGMTQDRILSDLWAQEPDIRRETTEWVYSFLLLAYSPASDADIEAYIAFSETEAGQRLNSALFAAFDGMYTDISRALGLATARFMVTQEL